MKLALIEDRIPRMEQFLEFSIKEFPLVEVFNDTNLNNLRLNIESDEFKNLNEFDCIATHRSAWTIEERSKLYSYCKEVKKPLIYFSGGITSSTFKDVEMPFLLINSKEFYSKNLKIFLEYMQSHDKLELSI
ncbi:hypothetical protein, partial [Tenacibaculum ovolyticum]|uniref:hypothetical protein n=1 Tax=Tenacibaculum ovolyticum TaxID=104270 RepID=UPI000ACA62AD